MKTRVRVLFVGQDSADVSLIELVLASEWPGVEVGQAADPVTFGREIERADFDMVVCDQQVEWAGVTRLVLEVHGRRPDATVVIFGESGDTGPGAIQPEAREVVLRRSSEAFLRLPDLLRSALARTADEERSMAVEPRVRRLLERSRIGVFRLTLDGRLLEADLTSLEILGARSLAEAQRFDLTVLTPQAPRGVTESGKLYRRELRLPGRGEVGLRVALTQVVSLDDDGSPVLDGLLEDISDRPAVDLGSSQPNPDAAAPSHELRTFASLAAHELKEPLRTIAQSTQMLLEDSVPSLSPRAEESADLIVSGVRKAQSMVDGLLTLAMFDGREEVVQPCDCNDVVRDVLDLLTASIRDSGAHIEVRALPTIRADAEQIRLLFRNLIGNALKFGGERAPEIRVSARQEGDDWVFSVEDRGIGIEPEVAERIFRRFARGGSGAGAGLGLAICKRVVERHGGRIWVESEPGMGATFFFTIPLAVSGRTDLSGGSGDSGSSGPRRTQGEVG